MGTWRDGGEIGGSCDLPPGFKASLDKLDEFQCADVVRDVFPLVRGDAPMRRNRVLAIKRLREISDEFGGPEWGLREAKDFVDLLYRDRERGEIMGCMRAIEDKKAVESPEEERASSGGPLETYARRRRLCSEHPGLSSSFRSLLGAISPRDCARVAALVWDFMEEEDDVAEGDRTPFMVRFVKEMREVTGLGVSASHDLLELLTERRCGVERFSEDDSLPALPESMRRWALVSRACEWALPVDAGDDVPGAGLALARRVLSIAADVGLASLSRHEPSVQPVPPVAARNPWGEVGVPVPAPALCVWILARPSVGEGFGGEARVEVHSEAFRSYFEAVARGEFLRASTGRDGWQVHGVVARPEDGA